MIKAVILLFLWIFSACTNVLEQTHQDRILSSENKTYIQIIRDNILQFKIYINHLRCMMNLPRHSMLFIPGDIIICYRKELLEDKWVQKNKF